MSRKVILGERNKKSRKKSTSIKNTKRKKRKRRARKIEVKITVQTTNREVGVEIKAERGVRDLDQTRDQARGLLPRDLRSKRKRVKVQSNRKCIKSI
jgi:hypothetical protein